MTEIRIVSTIAMIFTMIFFALGFFIGLRKNFWTQKRLKIFFAIFAPIIGIAMASDILARENLSIASRMLVALVTFIIVTIIFYLLSIYCAKLLSKEPFKSAYHIKDDIDEEKES